jgi:hypothetical protein
MKASRAPNVAAGCSICGRCPAWLTTANCACGKYALAPFEKAPGLDLAQLKRDLAVVVSAEALFTLTDLCGLSPDDAIASAVRTAAAVTAAAFRDGPAAAG